MIEKVVERQSDDQPVGRLPIRTSIFSPVATHDSLLAHKKQPDFESY